MLDKVKAVDIDRLPRQLFIGGEWVDAADGATLAVNNPFDNREILRISEAGEADVDRAVAAARAAFPAWAAMSGSDRARLLGKLVEKMEEGDLSLEDSLKTFEECIKLTRECQQALVRAEQKVKLLIEENGEVTATDFQAGED